MDRQALGGKQPRKGGYIFRPENKHMPACLPAIFFYSKDVRCLILAVPGFSRTTRPYPKTYFEDFQRLTKTLGDFGRLSEQFRTPDVYH